MTVRILTGHVLDRLAELPDESVHCCVTSPPYYGLRDYGIESVVWGGEAGCEHEWGDETRTIDNHNGNGSDTAKVAFNQASRYTRITTGFCRRCNAWRGSLGLEPTPALYVEHMVTVFRAVRRVLRKDATLWLNLGSGYASSAGKQPTQSLANAPACDSDDIEPQGSPNLDSVYSDRGDVHLNGSESRRGCSADNGRPPLQDVLPFGSTNHNKESLACSDEPMRPLAAQQSTILASSPNVPAAPCLATTVSLHQNADQTLPVDAQQSVHKAASKIDSEPLASASRNWDKDISGLACNCGHCGICFTRLAMSALRFKPKDLMMIPDLLALALQADGWYLRSEITWAKRAPMPESVTDRPTSATEKVFLLTKSARYFYDAEAVREESIDAPGESRGGSLSRFGREEELVSANAHRGDVPYSSNGKRNLRKLVGARPRAFRASALRDAFPSEIPRRAILAGTSEKGVCQRCGAPWVRIVSKGDAPSQQTDRQRHLTDVQVSRTGGTKSGGKDSTTLGLAADEMPTTETIGWQPTCRCNAGDPVPATVLDPFFGAGTTGLVADQLQRDCVGVELNPAYAVMAERRIRDDAPLFAHVEVRLPAANILMSGGGLEVVRPANGLELETMQLSKPNSTIGLEG